MKKILAVALSCAALPALMCGCSPTPKAQNHATPAPDTRKIVTPDTRNDHSDIDRDFAVIPHRSSMWELYTSFSVGRSPSGVYTVEYIHSPRDNKPDDTLDYKLELNADNTFTLTATANGVTADHYGHWYARRGGELTMYYDEPIDPSAHNVYVSDCLYGELLPHGKIMIYDNCNVIVLAKTAENNGGDTGTPEVTPYGAMPRKIKDIREVPPPPVDGDSDDKTA